MAKTIDISGQKFGRLTAINISGCGHHGEMIWNCMCSCGNSVNVPGSALRSGKTRSCGCLHREQGAKHMKAIQPLAATAKRTHGESNTRMYRIWSGMIQRCSNPKRQSYKYYGARGIRVCDRWLQYSNFKEDMDGTYFEGASIDRIDNDKGYYPENCRWIPIHDQFSNRRNQVRILLGGQCLSVQKVAEITGKSKWTLYKQLKKGAVL